MMRLEPISKKEAARYMGVRGEPDKNVAELLDKAELLVRKSVHPKYVYRETTVEQVDEGIKLGAVASVLIGNDVKKHLSGCERAVILAATLSSEADKLIRQSAVISMAESLAVDCICSAAIEQVCDRAEKEIFSEISAAYRTWRFSPGYGDLSISLQSDILSALNAHRRIGLTATENSILIPSKSVTAIIGISDEPIERGKKGCAVCNLRENCAFVITGGVCKSR